MRRALLKECFITLSDYLEQLTYLLFLKLADEYAKPPYNRPSHIPPEYSWEVLVLKRGEELGSFFRELLKKLGQQSGLLGQIFARAQNKFSDPAKLNRVLQMIDGEKWALMGTDLKGSIYEGLLQKNAEDTKSGAGQYFTPRPLIQAMVECIQPQPMKTIVDPACGTGGFFLAAYDFITKQHLLNAAQKEFLKKETFYGNEIVTSTRRLCLMNLYLHNIGDLEAGEFISSADALVSTPGRAHDYLLANPPFGKKSSMTFTNEEGELEKQDLTYNRNDFFATTSNKQLNFLQHIRSLLKIDGEAAVVLPDNVLFEGGAGERVRQRLMETTELHTILRLPTGIFYAQGVKANVLFFTNRAASPKPWTREVWVYDYRTNIHHTLKKKPMRLDDLRDFITLYHPGQRHLRQETWSEDTPNGRWRKFTYDEIVQRDKTNLDIFWLKDQSLADLENLPEPDVLAAEIIEGIEAALDGFREVLGE